MSDRALSPLIGSVLFVAIVLLLSVAVLALFSGVDSPNKNPYASTVTNFDIQINDSNSKITRDVVIRHNGGNAIDTENVELIIKSGGSTVTKTEPVTDTKLTAGGSARYNITDTGICDGGRDQVSMTLVDKRSGNIIQEQRYDVKYSNFSIDENTVSSNTNYRATVTVPNSGYAILESGYFLYYPVEATVAITDNNGSGQRLTPWPDGNPNDALTHSPEDDLNNPVYNYPYNYTTEELDSNQSVTVEMKSYVYSGDTDDIIPEGTYRTHDGTQYEEAHLPLNRPKFEINSSDPDEDNIKIYENGDYVPNYGTSSPHQTSLQEMLGDRLDSNGRLQLDDNEFVAVYDLNEDPSSADFNDIAVVFELEPVVSDQNDIEGEKSVLVCRK